MNEDMHLWCDCAPAGNSPHSALIEELSGLKIHCSHSRRGHDGPGLFFVRGAPPDAQARIREWSATAKARIVVVMMSPQDDAWGFLEAGAADVVPFIDPPTTAAAIDARFRRWMAVDEILDSPLVRSRLVGDGHNWRTFLGRVVDVARFSSMPVLLCGETGTGKELLARLVHALCPSPPRRELVTVDCTTIVPELSGSEFFGHEQGAFTGAIRSRDGAFALADGGTLFLDEVGELPPRLQAELLRVIQEGTYKRVGADAWRRADFRLVCATNRDLLTEVERGRFRRDLYSRLSAWTCHVPPLRKRREDIPALVRHFLRLRGHDDVAIEASVMRLLVSRDYPGNVRDLKHAVERILQRHSGIGAITLGDVPEEERPHRRHASNDPLEDAVRVALLSGMGLKDIARAATGAAVRLALDFETGHVGRAARLLRITDRALQKRRRTTQTGASLIGSPQHDVMR